ncbi:MAG: glycosyltransferase family 4 protein, partial [Cyanobacteria bacterium J06629_2]
SFAPANISVIKRWQGIRQCFRQPTWQSDHDLIISHFAFYTFPLLNLLQNRPLVTHFHGPWALESNVESNKSLAVKVKKLLEKSVYRRSQQFIVLSKTFRDILHQEYQVPLERIAVIPGGVDLERFNLDVPQTEARTKLNWSPEKPTIFCIRRLAKRMGLENLVAAMAIVCDKYPETMLYLGGKGELANSLQRQIDELGLNNNVKLLGYIADEDLPLCYRAADFSVVPTVALEGFGLIVIESLAAGTPVLGTPIGGIPEILRPFSPDLVFASSQSQDLATGIIEALSGKRQLPNPTACLEYVQNNYTWQVIAPQIKQVYQKAIAEKN